MLTSYIDAMVSGGRSEDDSIHQYDGIDHVYEERITSPISPTEPSSGIGHSSKANAQDDSPAVPVDVNGVDPVAENANEEVPKPKDTKSETVTYAMKSPSKILETKTVVLVETVQPELKISPSLVPLPFINNELQTRDRNEADSVAKSTGRQTDLSSSSASRPVKDHVLPETSAAFEVKYSFAESVSTPIIGNI